MSVSVKVQPLLAIALAFARTRRLTRLSVVLLYVIVIHVVNIQRQRHQQRRLHLRVPIKLPCQILRRCRIKSPRRHHNHRSARQLLATSATMQQKLQLQQCSQELGTPSRSRA